MQLSTLSILLGLLGVTSGLYALLKPSKAIEFAKSFPRSVPIGTVLVLVSTAWFVWNVKQEIIADFEGMKPFLIALFIAVGICTCIFVKDFLSVRGLAVFLLLLSKLMVDTARWAESDWRLIIVTIAYLWVIAGIWFTISPWRMRDLIAWSVASEKRLRTLSAARVSLGALLILLGIAAF